MSAGSDLELACADYRSSGFLKSVVRLVGERVTKRPRIVMKPTIAQHTGMLGPLGPELTLSEPFFAASSRRSCHMVRALK